MIKVELQNEQGVALYELEEGSSVFSLGMAISREVARSIIAAKVNGKTVNTRYILNDGDKVSFITFKDEEGKKIFRHTTSHILAQAVLRLYPDTKFAIGPAIDNGFYYDFEFSKPLAMTDFDAIEKEMKKIVSENLPIERFELPRAEALELMKDQPYKVELINDLPEGETISFYKQGDFTDLCAGEHLAFTGAVKAFKLTSLAGAYWRGSEKNKMLQRIYGTSFETKAELEAHLKAIEDAKARDHNKIGRELEYFTTVDIIGQGLPIMLPKGARTIQLLQRFVEDEEQRRGYLLTKTPFMAKRDLYKISGHWDHYRENMFIMGDPDAEGEVFALRPMTCPFQFQAYLVKTRSYRDLPMRLGETSTLFRNEASGEMHGLIRVRQFTISEGHLACTPEQLEDEFKGCLDLALYFLKATGLDDDVSYRFSKRDPSNREKYIGSAEEWEKVQGEMRTILDDIGIKYTEAEGEAAFYGPKLDIQIRNVHGKEDTLITIQIDFQLAERFGMEYVDKDGEKKNPYVIHRTSIGCYERTLALLLEKYAGALPLWMAPEQVRILTLNDRVADYIRDIKKALEKEGMRVELDERNEKIGFKIREAQVEKVPYMLVIGDKEMEENVIAVRSRADGKTTVMSLEQLIEKLKHEVETFAK
ncbi:MAG: threonine--tRNA ligase [Clostridiales bacterium]|nr:threonine--tRNA ligase [Clostridiales bacterium]